MSDRASNVLLAVSTLIVGLFCAGFAAAQIIPPQILLASLLP